MNFCPDGKIECCYQSREEAEEAGIDFRSEQCSVPAPDQWIQNCPAKLPTPRGDGDLKQCGTRESKL